VEVTELSARLDITGLVEFVRGMAQADASVDALRKSLRGLTADVLAARAALAGLRIDMAATTEVAALRDEVRRTRDTATEAATATKDIGVSDTAVLKEAALNAELRKTRDLALEAAAAARSIEGRSIPFGGGNLVGSAFGARDFGWIRGAGMFGLSGGGLTARDVEEGRRIASGGGVGGGGGGGGGGAGGFFAGLLPGGQRAGAGAVTAGIGLLAGAGPAVLPGVAAIAPILGAGAGTLIGAAGTLKLAFADLTAAAFTNRNAFLALTPVQQQFVQTLRSLDAGLLVRNLEPLAQRILLPQLTSALRSAFTPAAVSSLQGGVGAFANAIGGGAQQIGQLFGSSGFQAQFGTMLQQDAGYLHTFFSIFSRLLDGFVRFQVAAGPLLTWIGKISLGFASWADNAIKADAANGRLAHFFTIVQTSLQTTGNLLRSVGHLAGALFDAIGFQNSVALVNLVAAAINTLAELLRRNATLLRSFFSGAVAAAHDLLTAIRALISSFQPLLNLFRTLDATVKTLTGGISGFRVAIDAVATLLAVRLIPRLITTNAEMVAGGGAATTAAAGVSRLRLALVALLAVPPLWKGLSGLWSQIFGSDATTGLSAAGDLNPVRRNGVWVDPNTGRPLSPAGQAAASANAAGLLGIWGNVAAAGIGATPGAGNAGPSWFGFRPTTGPVNPATGIFGTTPPFGATGTTFQIPNQYLLALAKAQADQTSTRPTIAALQSVITYLRGVIPHLSPANQTTAWGQLTSYESQLNSLLGTGASRTGVGFLSQAMQTRLANAQQAAAGITGTTPVTAQGLQSEQGLLAQLLAAHASITKEIQAGTFAGKQQTAALAEQKTLWDAIVKAQQTLAQLRLQVPPAQQARLAAAEARTAGITATTEPTTTSIAALHGLLVQQEATLRYERARLASDRTPSAAREALVRHIPILARDAARTRQTLEQQHETLRQERILGIAGIGPGGVSAARETQTVRDFLNATLKQAGLAGTGSQPLGPFVQELYKLGDISKRQYESLEKILKVIDDARHHTGRIAAALTGNISQRLQEIKQELGSQTGFTLTGAQHSLRAIIHASGAHLTGTPAQIARALEQGQYAQAHGGMVLTNAGAAIGVPLTPRGLPSFSHIHVTVEAKGNTQLDRANARIIAAEVAEQLRRKTNRNSTQMTGSNAGVNMGG
jgi:hypothetical protein